MRISGNRRVLTRQSLTKKKNRALNGVTTAGEKAEIFSKEFPKFKHKPAYFDSYVFSVVQRHNRGVLRMRMREVYQN